MSDRSRMRPLAGTAVMVLAVFALLAAGCVSDSDETGADGAPASSGDGSEPTATPGDDGAVELTATDEGVTESVIRVGAVFPDTNELGQSPGDIDAKFETVVDAINAAGGINGRTIELTVSTPNPTADVGFDGVCVELTEDIGVFAAVGLFPRTNADCYAARNDTIVISAFPISAEQMESYTAPGLTIDAHAARLVEERVAKLLDEGVLAQGSKIALHGGEQGRDAHEAYKAAFEAAGVEVVADTVGVETGQNILAVEAEMDIFAEVWQASGAESVVASAGLASQAILIAYNTSNVDLPMVLPEGTGVPPSLLQNRLGLDLAPFELATALVEGDNQATKYETGADGVRECVDAFEAASGEAVALDESMDNLGVTVVACQVFDIFTQIAEAAGPELTTESFAAAAEAFGPIEVTDLSEASVGPDKWDLNDSVGVVAEFNPETVRFEPVA